MRASTATVCTIRLAILVCLAGCGAGEPATTVGHDTTDSHEPDTATAVSPDGEAFADVRGGNHRLPGPGQARATVLLFLGHDCPISNAYAPEVGRLHAAYSGQGVAFCVVYADADLSPAAGRAHAADFALPCPAVLDPDMTLARRVGATVKPQAALLGPAGELLYLGRIDDRYADYGTRRAEPTTRDLHAALDAVLAGKPVAVPRTQAFGCDIDLPTAKN